MLVNSVRNAKGDVLANFKPDHRQVLDPRIAYIMTNMMEGVINNGLGYHGGSPARFHSACRR